MNVFERDKRRRNLAEGYKETKGLKDGHCNRRACQAPLAGTRQFYMRDHETFTDGRLYYCDDCAAQFDMADRRMMNGLRCTLDEATVCS